MNYNGEVMPSGTDPKSIYSYLKEAMLLISEEYPFRGPERLQNQNFRYENQQHGSLDRFYGFERIYENNENVYVLYYHGGKIKKTL